ncbi:hypothetical protein Pint_28249 [Pistacia integerrima]|uniref:Uncharacterized protein n=1 Tax=Pistacia integerrima TaxID=434235 RepID=A0ACC0YR61_9ROSI|nr:hypothetical protein Pint_28249 [Pistacia integerrima]
MMQFRSRKFIPARKESILFGVKEKAVDTWLLMSDFSRRSLLDGYGPPAHRFSALKHFAPDDSVEDLLGVLQKHAQLVQVKSEQLLVEAKLKDHIKRVLNVFAVERPSFKDWKFKEHRDVSFIKEYPNIVKKQEQVWAAAEKQVTDVINRSRKVGPCKGVATQKSGTAGKLLRAMNSDEGATGVQTDGVDTADFEEVVSQVATNIHGYYVSKSSSEHPEYDQLRKVVIDLLLVRGADAKLRKADVVEAARLALKRENITEKEYKKVMSDICESKGGVWVLKKQK